MALSNEKIREYTKRLLLSRMRVLVTNGFYGLLLMHMIFAIDEKCPTAATDGYRIYFNPKFMDDLSDKELDFILMHEILHVVLNHCNRYCDRDAETFNIACDIVVNSNILRSNNMNPASITLKKAGELMHQAPNGDEGYKYTAEEVYSMLSPMKNKNRNKNESFSIGKNENKKRVEEVCGGFELCRAKHEEGKMPSKNYPVDDHSRWTCDEDDDILREVWAKRVVDAAITMENRAPSNTRGTIPLFANRILENLRNPQTDWRTVLSDFVQEEVCDYSFSPPDRRFDGFDFYLPDFNGTEISISDILFMIDTSGSMSDEMIAAAYSEIKGAIDQFDGKLRGWLGFFDAAIIEPKPFENEDEFKVIKPAGGGGTDFQIIFEYVHQHMQDNPPKSIIILTDGIAPFPKESLANDIPVLWLLNNEEIDPPWGRVARITV